MTAGEKNCMVEGGSSALRFAGFGLLVSAYKNATQVHKAGAIGVFSRTGGDIGYFGAIGLAYTSATCLAEQIREKDDHWNNAIGGALAGFVAGARNRDFRSLAFGTFVGAFSMWLYGYTGATMLGLYHGEDIVQRQLRRERFFESEENMKKSKEEAELVKEYRKNYYPKN